MIAFVICEPIASSVGSFIAGQVVSGGGGGFLLLEDDSFLLLEDGSKIELE